MSNLTHAERFWRKVEKSDGCWTWVGGYSRDGYGVFHFEKSREYAHRYAYKLSGLHVPAGKVLDHRCYNRACVRPEHLVPVTNKQNMENRPGPQANSTSGIRGVSFDRSRGQWRAHVKHAGVSYNAGRYETKADAEAAVIAKRNELFTNNLLDRKAS